MASRLQRVPACVTREREGRTELLVFDRLGDPTAGTQVPDGRLDHGESLDAVEPCADLWRGLDPTHTQLA
jgi:hypothetical protein